MKINNNQLQNGVSGIMRVKNDAEFIEASIDSCIGALDELVIVYNDCSDNSPELIYNKQKQYPDKIKVYEYKHKIYSINLTKEEYEYAKTLPADSPHLLCNYYNFALSKVNYKYAMKIDADQIYFTDKLKEWCDVYRYGYKTSFFTKTVGMVAWAYSRAINKINLKRGKVLHYLPQTIVRRLYPYYQSYIKSLIAAKKVNASLSGLDVVYDNGWLVTIGKKNNIINILPPYNGVGDHLIFKVTDEVYYRPDDCPFYNKLRTDSFTMIERFVCNDKAYTVGVFWFHLNAMRNNVRQKVKGAIKEYPNSVMTLETFSESDYDKDIEPCIDREMMLPYQRSMLQFIHQGEAHQLPIHKKYLETINL